MYSEVYRVYWVGVLTSLEMEVHVLAHNPSQKHEEWSDKEGNLHARSDGNSHSLHRDQSV